MSILNENISIFNNPADPIERMQPVCHQMDLVDPDLCRPDLGWECCSCDSYNSCPTYKVATCLYNCASNTTPKKVTVTVHGNESTFFRLEYFNTNIDDNTAYGHKLYFSNAVKAGEHSITVANVYPFGQTILFVSKNSAWGEYYKTLTNQSKVDVFITKTTPTTLPPCSSNTYQPHYPFPCECNAMCNIHNKCPYNIPISPCSCNGNTCSCNGNPPVCQSQCSCNANSCPCNTHAGCTTQCASHARCPCNSQNCNCNKQCSCNTKG